MEILNQILENTNSPFIMALVLGLMTAISPCPMATNITAIGFISKDIEDKRRVFVNGILYTIGRSITYTFIGLLFFFGADEFNLSGWFQEWGEKLLGPLLVIIGLFMLGLFKFSLPGISKFTDRFEDTFKNGYKGALLLGMVFALAFCPYSGVLFFGMLIPITINSASGLYLPIVFAIATGVPVILFSWLLAYSVGSVGKLYNGMKSFEFWFRKVVAVLFIGVGIYYSIMYYL